MSAAHDGSKEYGTAIALVFVGGFVGGVRVASVDSVEFSELVFGCGAREESVEVGRQAVRRQAEMMSGASSFSGLNCW